MITGTESDLRTLEIGFVGSGEILQRVLSRLQEGYTARVAVAFLRLSALKPLLPALAEITGQFVVGASRFYITDSLALRKLATLSRKNGNLGVRMNSNTGFHPKVFYFEKGEEAEVILGSSNLTGGGFGTNTEANIVVQGTTTDDFFIAIKRFLQAIYEQAEPLEGAFIEDYAKRSAQFRKTVLGGSRLSGSTPTPLPKFSQSSVEHESLKLSANVEFWKVAPGRRAEDWPRWENAIDSNRRGLIAIGWSKVGDLQSHFRQGANSITLSNI